MISLDNFITESDSNNKNISNLYINCSKNKFDFIIESEIELNNIYKSIYKNILESKSYSILNESFYDVFDGLKLIISRCLRYIENLIKNFEINISKTINNETELLSNKNLFLKYPKNIKFNIEGYIFKLENNIPIVSTAVNEPDFLRIPFNRLKDKNSNEKTEILSDLVNTFNKSFNDTLSYYRGEILGLNEKISESEFISKTKEIFGTNNGNLKKLNITYIDVSKSYKIFTQSNRYIQSVYKDKNKLEKSYNRLFKELDFILNNLNSDNKVCNSFTEDIEINDIQINKIYTYISKKIVLLQKITNLHSIAFHEKIAAYTLQFYQSKTILYKALEEYSKYKGGH